MRKWVTSVSVLLVLAVPAWATAAERPAPGSMSDYGNAPVLFDPAHTFVSSQDFEFLGSNPGGTVPDDEGFFNRTDGLLFNGTATDKVGTVADPWFPNAVVTIDWTIPLSNSDPTLYTGGEFLRYWVDWNRDNVWTNDELMIDARVDIDILLPGTLVVTRSFVVPASATAGETWCRAVLAYNDPIFAGEPPTAYSNRTFGELEDYHPTINVVTAVAAKSWGAVKHLYR